MRLTTGKAVALALCAGIVAGGAAMAALGHGEGSGQTALRLVPRPTIAAAAAADGLDATADSTAPGLAPLPPGVLPSTTTTAAPGPSFVGSADSLAASSVQPITTARPTTTAAPITTARPSTTTAAPTLAPAASTSTVAVSTTASATTAPAATTTASTAPETTLAPVTVPEPPSTTTTGAVCQPLPTSAVA